MASENNVEIESRGKRRSRFDIPTIEVRFDRRPSSATRTQRNFSVKKAKIQRLVWTCAVHCMSLDVDQNKGKACESLEDLLKQCRTPTASNEVGQVKPYSCTPLNFILFYF